MLMLLEINLWKNYEELSFKMTLKNNYEVEICLKVNLFHEDNVYFLIDKVASANSMLIFFLSKLL